MRRETRRTRGYTLVEVMVVVTIIGILAALCAPALPRAVEQSRADLAAANLRSIWAAQRFYRLESGIYADSLLLLRARGLLDASVVATDDSQAVIEQYQPSYLYRVDSADLSTFTASAVRNSSTAVAGQNTLTIDESGVVSGTIAFHGRPPVTPGRLFTRMGP